MNPKELARELVEARSPSGAEGPALLVAERRLREAGMTVERQEVGGPERFNLLARHGHPRAVLSTHLDTVPGELPVRVERDTLHGRGACDAKGSAAAMIAAAEELVGRGASDFGVLFVVGEETDSDGALAADALITSGDAGWAPTDALLAEPTSNRFVSAHPGVVVASYTAEGRAAHSAFPEEGRSAVHALLGVLQRVRGMDWPEDPELGPTRFNVGQIEGGSAANVVAAEARAEVLVRSGARTEDVLRRLADCSPCTLHLACRSEPVRFEPPPPGLLGLAELTGLDGEPPAPVPFATDAPFLASLGRLSLFGPGSIRLAHSDEERVTGAELLAARGLYVAWILNRLSATARGSR